MKPELTTAAFYAPITKVDKTPEGHRIVTGVLQSERPDVDGQVADYDWFKGQAETWFRKFANVREMHDRKAAGKGLDIQFDDVNRSVTLVSKAVDRDTIVKLDEGVLTGYSFGVKNDPANPVRVIKSADAPKGRIVGGLLIEASYVDRPANEDCVITIAKMAGGELELTDIVEKAAAPTEQDVVDDTHAHEHTHDVGTDHEYSHSHPHGHADGLHADGAEADHAHPHAHDQDGDDKAAMADLMKATASDKASKTVDADLVKDGEVPVMTGDEAHHNDAYQAARDAIKQLISQEMAEDDAEFDCVSWLANVGNSLDAWARMENAPDLDDGYFAAFADLVKAATEPDLVKRRVFYSRDHRQAIEEKLQELNVLVAGDLQGPVGTEPDGQDAPTVEGQVDGDNVLNDGELHRDGDGSAPETPGAAQAGPDTSARPVAAGSPPRPGMPVAKAAEPDLMTAAMPDTIKAAVADLLKGALVEFEEGLVEKFASVSAVTSLRAELDELGQRAQPGGPFVGQKAFAINEGTETGPSIEVLEKMARLENLSQSTNHELAASARHELIRLQGKYLAQ